METSVKSNAVNQGLYLGGILALITVLAYAVNLDLFTKWWYGIGLMIFIIIMGIVSAMKSRKLLNGFITFKGAFSSYFITIVIGIVISTIVSLIIFNIVDPEAAVLLQEKTVDAQVEMMRNFGAPENAIAQVVEELEKDGSMFSIGKVLQSIAVQLVIFSVIGLIVALVVKKEDVQA